MAYTTEQLAALEAAIARGVRTVSYNGESVTYESLAEMRKLRAEMRAEMGQTVHDKSLFPTIRREV
jgi:roadblock/LC7 domain-containing protein